MKITIQRQESIDDYTPGEMLIDGGHFCWTLEDKIREVKGRPPVEWKIYGKTAIPEGLYPVAISWSGRFRRQMLEVLNVPGFAGIRIHNGKSEANTEGCPLVHFTRTDDLRFPDYDREAMRVLEEKVMQALIKKEKIFLEVRNPEVNNQEERDSNGTGC